MANISHSFWGILGQHTQNYFKKIILTSRFLGLKSRQGAHQNVPKHLPKTSQEYQQYVETRNILLGELWAEEKKTLDRVIQRDEYDQ